MTDEPKQSLAVLRRIAEFIEALPPEHVDDLAEGRARLTLIPWGSNEPIVPAAKPARKTAKTAASTIDATAVAAQVEAAATREDAHAILNPLKVADLKAIATALQVTAPSGTKAALIKQIIELTAGARLTGDALRAL